VWRLAAIPSQATRKTRHASHMKKILISTKFKDIIYRLSNKLSMIGGFALFCIILVTCFDVIGTKIFKKPFSGSYEIVFLAQLVAIALASGDTLIYGRHVHVEMFVLKMPERLRKIVSIIVSLSGLTLFVVAAWEGFVYAISLKAAHEVTGTVKIPLYPFAFILGISGVLLSLVYLVKIIEIFRTKKA